MKNFKQNLKEFFGSKKVKATLSGCLAVLLVQYLELPKETAIEITGMVMMLVYGISKKDVAELQNKDKK